MQRHALALVFALAFVLCLALAGCKPGTQEMEPVANVADTQLLHTAQGRLAPGVAVCDVRGVQLGRILKVDPDHTFANGMRGGVRLDYDDPRAENGYLAAAYFVRP